MQRIRKFLSLHKQTAAVLRNHEKIARGLSGSVIPCAEDSRLRSLGTVLPNHQHAHIAYNERQSYAVEQRLSQGSGRVKHEVRMSGNYMSDMEGLISSECVLLSPISQQELSYTALKNSATYSSDSVANTDEGNKPPNDSNRSNLPSEAELEDVKSQIMTVLPKFFRSNFHYYSGYTPDIIFENNYSGKNKVYKGVSSYAMQLTKIRTMCNLKFASIHMYILNITTHTEDGTVRVRWTMKGTPQLKALMFWKWNLFTFFNKDGIHEQTKKNFQTLDGFNTFWVNKDGLVYRHRLDRVMPDEERKTAKVPGIINRKLTGAANMASKCDGNADSGTCSLSYQH